jgi:alpha-tubulin suppressor-like RCC1 family protein
MRRTAWLSCGSGGTGALAHGGTHDAHALARSLFPDSGGDDDDAPTSATSDGWACVAVAAGGMHTVTWRRGGDASTLLACGDDTHGQLGAVAATALLAAPPTQTHVPSPLHMALPAGWSGSRRVAAVACGWRHTVVVLADDGSVWTCGYGADGQLGLGDVAFGGGGGGGGGGAARTAGLSRVPLPSAATAVACGHVHTIVADVTGTVWGWGRDRHGCLALPPAPAGVCHRTPALLAAANAAADGDRAVAVCAGANHSAALTAAGRVLTWGDNRHGQCGRPPGELGGEGGGGGGGGNRGAGREAAAAAAAAAPHSLPPGYVQLCDDTVPDSHGELTVTSLACGWSHMAALAVERVTGGIERDAAPAVSAPSAAACGTPAIVHARHPLLLTWGRGDMGQLGRRVAGPPGGGVGDTGQRSHRAHDWRPAPVDLRPTAHDGTVAQHSPAVASAALVPRGVACGSEHVAVVTECGRVLAWGWNEHGNLGTGDTDGRDAPVEVAGVAGAGGGAVGVAAGGATTWVAVRV